MSHYFVGVILPKGTKLDETQEVIDGLLAPYDKNMQVAEYKEECWCVGHMAGIDARKQTERQVGTFNSLRDSFKEKHPLHNKPNAVCEECKGTGLSPTTYNPKSKWDWYRIGGRWDGVIQNKEIKSTDNGFNFGNVHQLACNNIITVKDLLTDEKQFLFAVVLPDGNWIEKGKMGWWGLVSNKKEKKIWDGQLKDILGKYTDHMVVGVDCHI